MNACDIVQNANSATFLNSSHAMNEHVSREFVDNCPISVDNSVNLCTTALFATSNNLSNFVIHLPSHLVHTNPRIINITLC